MNVEVSKDYVKTQVNPFIRQNKLRIRSILKGFIEHQIEHQEEYRTFDISSNFVFGMTYCDDNILSTLKH